MVFKVNVRRERSLDLQQTSLRGGNTQDPVLILYTNFVLTESLSTTWMSNFNLNTFYSPSILPYSLVWTRTLVPKSFWSWLRESVVTVKTLLLKVLNTGSQNLFRLLWRDVLPPGFYLVSVLRLQTVAVVKSLPSLICRYLKRSSGWDTKNFLPCLITKSHSTVCRR